MPPKQAQKGKAKAKGPVAPKKEDVPDAILQAVVLADSFNKRFRPLTLEKPRCLLPLANIPLIEYTFEFLALAGVEEVFMFCCAHADQIEEYVKDSKWVTKSSPFTLKLLPTPTSMSVGDVMRDLDLKGFITTDFLLVSGDIVSNIPMGNILDEHRERRSKDKNSIMTMLLRESSPQHRTRAGGENGVFVLDQAGQRCLHYEEMRGEDGEHTITLEQDILKEHKDVQIRNDLIDCYVDIVSPDVPALFTENFDYQHIRRDFVHGILTDSELYGKNIHVHIMDNQYAARVRSLQTYDAVSRDIANRWVYPLCPDSNLLSGQSYQYERVHFYKERNAILDRRATVHGACIIGDESTIDEGSVLTDTFVGRNCVIGKNVILTGAYIWDNVIIGDNCKVENSIVASNVQIAQDCTISSGSIISYNVKLAAETTTDAKARITNFSDTENESTQTDAKVVGEKGSGHVYVDSDSEDDDERSNADQLGFAYGLSRNVSTSSLESMSDLSEDETDPIHKRSRRLSSSTAATTTKSHGSSTSSGKRRGSLTSTTSEETEEDSFYREAYISLLTALEADHPVEVIGLELNGLRMTADAPFTQVRHAATAAMMTRVEQLLEDSNKPAGTTLTTIVDKLFTHLNILLKRMIFDMDDQVDFLLWLQKVVIKREKGGAMVQAAAFKMYNDDLITEDAVMKWWGSKESIGEGSDDMTKVEMVKVKEACKGFVDWLQEAEEEDSDDDDEDEDDE